MSAVHDKAFELMNAKDRLKQREEATRNAAILRTLNDESEEMKVVKFKLAAAKATLMVAIAFNFYAAAKGWGLLQ